MKISLTSWLAALAGFFVSLILGDFLFSALAVALTVLAITNFITKIGNSFPLLDLVFLISVLQLLLGPYFAYRLPISYFRYKMYVPELDYMKVAVASHVLFLIGLLLNQKPFDIQRIKWQIVQITNRYPFIGIHIIVFGLITNLTQPFVPLSIQFIFYLAGNLIYIGAILYYFSEGRKFRTAVYFGILLLGLLQATQSGLFHDFLLWAVLGFSLVSINTNLSVSFRIILVAIGIFSVMILQSVKFEFRNKMANSSLSIIDRFMVLSDLALSQLKNPDNLFTPEKLSELNVRLNQGWITSAIMLHVPAKVPFANGSTIWISFQNAFLPRILFPDKLNANGRDNFRLYTGIPIDNYTSMGVGLLGEAYINFGSFAGLFLLFWGWLLGVVIQSINRLSKINVIFFLLTPLIYLQVIKVETDMITVLNYFVKSLIFVSILYAVWLGSYRMAAVK
jgi:hypothetical protein